MSETIAVMFIFFILVVFGLIFYFKFSTIAAQQAEEELFGQKAIDTTTKVIFLPELICSDGEAETQDFCLDMMKLKSMDAVTKKHLSDYYFDLFGYANISVTQIYPVPTDQSTFTIYSKKLDSFTRKDPTFFTVSLKDYLTGSQPSFGLGYVTVEVYS